MRTANEDQLKVLLTTNIPAPYMVEYLDLLGKRCNLTVLFEIDKAKDRKNKWYGNISNKSFNAILLNAYKTSAESGLSLKVLKYLKQPFDRIIIANPMTPTGIVSLLYCRFKNIPFILQSEGGFRGSGKGFKEKFKKYLMEKASLFLSGMQGETEYFLSYGANKDTLRWYPFSSLKEEQIDKALLSREQKEILKKELGILEEKMIISVGRMLECKGFDVLLNACVNIPKSVGVYIVGGLPKQEYSKIIDRYNLSNVHFIEHCDYQTLCKYYHCSDVFALPTRGDTWGLVINEAMANGLPVITTDMCIAGLQLIKDDINGYIVPTDNHQLLAERINYLLENDSLRMKMAEYNLDKIKIHTLENMSEYIFNAIKN